MIKPEWFYSEKNQQLSLLFISTHVSHVYIAIFTPLVRFLRNRMKYSIIQYSMYITFNYLYKQIILNVTKIYTNCSFFSYLIRYLIFLLAIFVPLI